MVENIYTCISLWFRQVLRRRYRNHGSKKCQIAEFPVEGQSITVPGTRDRSPQCGPPPFTRTSLVLWSYQRWTEATSQRQRRAHLWGWVSIKIYTRGSNTLTKLRAACDPLEHIYHPSSRGCCWSAARSCPPFKRTYKTFMITFLIRYWVCYELCMIELHIPREIKSGITFQSVVPSLSYISGNCFSPAFCKHATPHISEEENYAASFPLHGILLLLFLDTYAGHSSVVWRISCNSKEYVECMASSISRWR